MTEFNEADHRREDPTRPGAFSEKHQSSPEAGLGTPRHPLADSEPKIIDTRLAELFNDIHRLRAEVAATDLYIADYKRIIEKEDSDYYKQSHQRSLDRVEERRAKLIDELVAPTAEAAELEEEFTNRGGWTRAFLVQASNGHVHKTRGCSTCFLTTSFYWLPEYSGGDEDQIVDDAGEAACTVCYPSAPVDVLRRKTRIEDPVKKASRIEREEKAAAKAAKLERDSIANPDGTPIKVGSYWDVIKKERAAEITAVDRVVSLLADERSYQIPNRAMIPIYQADVETLLAALAHKRGTDVETQRQLVTAKAEKKWKREWAQR